MDYIEYGKVPPQAVDLEQSVLCAIMLHPESIYDVATILFKPEVFYKNSHIKIYKAILDLFNEEVAIDLLTVTEQLKKTSELEEIGGYDYLTVLSGKISTSVHIIDHAKILLEKYLRREMIRATSELNNDAFDNSKDFKLLMNQVNKIPDLINSQAVQGDNVKKLGEFVKESVDDLSKREQSYKKREPTGVPTPIQSMTVQTNGWANGKLIIIAGRPSMGKSAFMLSNARKSIGYGFIPLIFSLEMNGVSLADRLIIGESKVKAHDYRIGRLSQQDWNNIEKNIQPLIDSNILIDDTAYADMDYIHNVSRLVIKKGLAQYIMIDYLQLIRSQARKHGMNREQEISDFTKRMKSMAKELDVPVILFAQLNRDVEKSGGMMRPQLHHLRESGSMENDADMVVLLYRPERYGITEYENGDPTKGVGEAIVAKFREGSIDTFNFIYNESLTVIRDEKEQSDEERDEQAINPEIPFDSESPF